MRKLTALFFIAIFVLFGALTVLAEPNHDGYHQNNQHQQPSAHNPERVHARNIINKTAVVLVAAQKAARHGHHQFGLTRAIEHQKLARIQYERGFYRDAIYHSLRSRSIAIEIIRANRRPLPPEADFDRIERRYRDSAPSDHDLDLKIKARDNDRDDRRSIEIIIDMDIDL